VKVGIVCYASVGGSGIVATELARHLVVRGHQVHVLSSDVPFRLRQHAAGVTFHQVDTPDYPLFREPQYLLSLATRIVDVVRRHRLDVVHAHYAVPHATAAWLARNILAASRPGPVPRLVTTLHGTDITIVGSDPSYATTVAFSIDQGDAVTAVSKSLREATLRALPIKSGIDVIHNFLDCGVFRRRPDVALRAALCPPEKYDALVIHLSNFRPVKRVDVVIEVFHRLRRGVRARLVLAGDGPDSAKVQARIAEYGLDDDVLLLPAQQDVVSMLSCADLFLLPSLEESFGLAALEAMACEVPVVASRVGGLPEVIDDGVTGALCEPSDVDGMAARGLELLTDARRHAEVAAAARQAVVDRFCVDRIVPQYEAVYRRVCQGEVW
jgi:N-acetyl-alpha-D-glucosaminyl L-malate synthase BshA